MHVYEDDFVIPGGAIHLKSISVILSVKHGLSKHRFICSSVVSYEKKLVTVLGMIQVGQVCDEDRGSRTG